MEQPTTGFRTCPECDSSDYMFRHRKRVTDEQGTAVETKYRCKSCGHEWNVRAPAPR